MFDFDIKKINKAVQSIVYMNTEILGKAKRLLCDLFPISFGCNVQNRSQIRREGMTQTVASPDTCKN